MAVVLFSSAPDFENIAQRRATKRNAWPPSSARSHRSLRSPPPQRSLSDYVRPESNPRLPSPNGRIARGSVSLRTGLCLAASNLSLVAKSAAVYQTAAAKEVSTGSRFFPESGPSTLPRPTRFSLPPMRPSSRTTRALGGELLPRTSSASLVMSGGL